MLNQAPGDRASLARLLGISETQQQYINNARKGSGLIWTGSSIIPFYDEFPTNTRLYALMSTNATENLQEMVTNERMSRNRQELSEKEKADQEYIEHQRQQSEMYGIRDPFAESYDGFSSQDKPAEKPQEPQRGGLSGNMNDYPDDGFGPDPFALAFSEGGFNDKAKDDLFDDEDDEMPDEFDTLFGGGTNSVFDMPTKKPMATEPKPQAQKKPEQTTGNKPQTAQTSGNKNQDALNSFFNL